MKRFLALILFSLMILTSVFSVGALVDIVEGTRSVYDGGELLLDEEELTLTVRLDSLRDAYGYDIVVVTVDTLGELTPQEYADDFYDYNGYSYNGILLLVCMEYRDWAISTAGECIDIFNDDAQEYLSDNFIPYMSEGDFASVFTVFADDCDEILQNADAGRYYGVDYGRGQGGFYFSFSMVLTAIAVGVIIAFISVLVMKGKLNSVSFRSAAADYLRRDKVKVTESRDIFLYSTVSRVAKPKDNSGHSSVHTSSSGRSHGGSSGKF